MNQHTDTRLTDYALDELSDAERLEVEALLKSDDGAAAEVDQLRGLAKALRAATVVDSVEQREPATESGIVASELRSIVETKLASSEVVPGDLAPAVERAPPRKSWLRRHWKVAAVGIGGVTAASLALILPAFQIARESGKSRTWFFSQDEVAQSPGAQGGADGAPLDGGLRYGKVPAVRGDEQQLLDLRSSLGFFEFVDGRRNAGVDSDGIVALEANGNVLLGATSTTTPNSTTLPTSPAGVPLGNGTAVTHHPSATNVDVSAVNVFGRSASTFAGAGPESPIAVNGGTLSLSGANTITGITTNTAGTLTLPAENGRGQASPHQGVTKVSAGTLTLGSASTAAMPTSPPTSLPTVTYSGTSSLSTASTLVDTPASSSPVTRFGRAGLQAQSGTTPASVTSPAVASLAVPSPSQTLRGVHPRQEAEHERLASGFSAFRKLPALEQKLPEVEERSKVLEVELARQDNRFFDTEAYDAIIENPFLRPTDAPLSTFSIDVDTASYSNVRRILTSGQRPPRGAVRIEEFLNYFSYDYPQPKSDEPFSVTTEAARCPWNAEHVLVRVGLKGKEIHRKERPASNLVFLVDVSGSMQDENKLPLVRESLKLLVRELGDSDRVSMVVYAGNTGLVLKPTGGNRKQEILDAIDLLGAGGSTNGGAGIQLAYQLAADNFIKGGVNRVVLATDGDFNVGVTSQDELVRLIEEKAKSGVFFTALGYGMGNLKDSTLEKLADKGNGNYAYIDTLAEARKVLVEQMSGTLVTIAKDVKIQIEFNPTRVAGYRLIGYENRVLAAQDFNDDKKDAGEIGAGHTVTALYELIPVGKKGNKEARKLPEVDPLKYQPVVPEVKPAEGPAAKELLTLKLRYKQPDGDTSKLLEQPLADDVNDYAKASADFKFASAVAGFGMLLRQSQFKGTATYDAVLELAQEGIGDDKHDYRREFIELVRKAKDLTKGE